MDLKKYIYSHCVSPVPVKTWDALSCQFVVREQPCGKCLHCRNTHVNSWVTRLYAQQKYSKHTYYITLDYAPFSYENVPLSDPTVQQLAAETAACWHNLNKNHKYGLHPILLNKNHLQDFFKRFRKNTGIKIQYFACGEYGTKAEGTGYGRPHFHIIVFSDTAISQKQFEDAWSVNGYQIGRVDFNDLDLNGTTNPNLKNGLSSSFVFKYVCKYLQKGNFDFESLSTINFHRAYFKSLQYVLDKADTLFPELVPITDSKTIEFNWQQYIRDYSPFVVCSKRPSIGLEYFKENEERFCSRDYRLFGLSAECTVFPAYYKRKAKEKLFSFCALGSDSLRPSTSSRIGYILSVLTSLRDMRLQISDTFGNVGDSWCAASVAQLNNCKNANLLHKNDLYINEFGYIKATDLHIYDTMSKIMYQFNGYGYNLWKKYNSLGFVKIGYMDIVDVINKIYPKYQVFKDNYLTPEENSRVLHQNELYDTISNLYSGDWCEKLNSFRNDVFAYYQAELDSMYKRDLLTNNSKNTF